MAYISKCKDNLPIFGIKNKVLREFRTTEKDVDKGISRIPLQLARLIEEDMLGDKVESATRLSEHPDIVDDYT